MTPKEKRLNELFNRLGIIADSRSSNFLNFNLNPLDPGIRPDPNKKHNFKRSYATQSSVQKSGPFDCYSDGYLYRYKVIGNTPINVLLQWMVSDIVPIYHSIPQL